MTEPLKIGLVAHDARKPEIVAWAKRHRDLLALHRLVGTGTTGGAVAEATGLDVERLKSGPVGGDAQLGARIVEGELDILVFFIDTMASLPHDVDVKALVRLATLYNVVFACNAATADLVMAGLATRGEAG